jgi:hypothetical protein
LSGAANRTGGLQPHSRGGGPPPLMGPAPPRFQLPPGQSGSAVTYRVVQWATGAVGKTCLRAVLDHPNMTLAGLYVYSPRKAGQDAGTIARYPETGIIATRDISEILALDADVVIHAARLQLPYTQHDDDICALLRSGKNVITTAGHHYPAAHGPARLAMFEYGQLYGEAIAFTCDRMGVAVDEIAADHRVVCAERDLEIGAGRIAAGTVAATEWRWHAISAGQRFLTLSIIWTMDPELADYAGRHHWTVDIEGRPDLHLSLDMSDPPGIGLRTKAGQYVTTGAVVNAIPAVVAAPPGVFAPPVFAPFRRP